MHRNVFPIVIEELGGFSVTLELHIVVVILRECVIIICPDEPEFKDGVQYHDDISHVLLLVLHIYLGYVRENERLVLG